MDAPAGRYTAAFPIVNGLAYDATRTAAPASVSCSGGSRQRESSRRHAVSRTVGGVAFHSQAGGSAWRCPVRAPRARHAAHRIWTRPAGSRPPGACRDATGADRARRNGRERQRAQRGDFQHAGARAACSRLRGPDRAAPHAVGCRESRHLPTGGQHRAEADRGQHRRFAVRSNGTRHDPDACRRGACTAVEACACRDAARRRRHRRAARQHRGNGDGGRAAAGAHAPLAGVHRRHRREVSRAAGCDGRRLVRNTRRGAARRRPRFHSRRTAAGGVCQRPQG